MIRDALRERYLRDPLPIRLGNLASDLARIASCSENPKNHEVVMSVLEESKYFAEWAAAEAPPETQAILAEVQLQLALWHRRWLQGHPEPLMQHEVRRWSDQLLEHSGLLTS